MRFLKPPPLRPGDPVSVIAPGGAFDRASFDAGLEVLSRRYSPQWNNGIFASQRYLAGDDARRLGELTGAFADPQTKAVFCARGGYGSIRLLDSLSFRDLPLKPLVGFSDITALHASFQSAGRISIHGPVVTRLGRSPRAVVERLYSVLESAHPPDPLSATDCLVPGIVEGPLIGGNLSVLTRLLGTPYFPEASGAILLLEDVGERPYRLDRMWTHLRLAGIFKKVRGIALGELTGCEENSADYSSLDVLRELASETRLPCAAGFPIGHGEANWAVPLGCRARLDATQLRLEFLEPAVAETATPL